MTRFFVYISVKDKDKDYEFVESNTLGEFAKNEFDAKTMKFSGIAIEAEDFCKALTVYNHPDCGFGEYIIVDEPKETASKLTTDVCQTAIEVKSRLEQLTAKLEYLQCMLVMKLAASKLAEANKLMNDVSERIHVIYNKPSSMTPDMIFEKISKAAVEGNIKYYGESKKPG